MKEEQRWRWKELEQLLERSQRGGVEALSVEELKRLCRLYRQVAIDLSRARAGGEGPEVVGYLNLLAARAHGRVYAGPRVDIRPLFTFLVHGFPAQIRRRWLPILITAGVFVLAALASFVAVARDPELAYSLFDERIVEYENVRLEKQEGEYRGNFTFSVAESPWVAVQIIANNIRVAAVVFALGAVLCLPSLLLLVLNGRMLGTLTGLVWNYGFFGDFYALVLTHGVLELSAICISAAGGLMLGWAVIAPGRYGRGEALRRVSGDALGLLAGASFMLVAAGLIEAYVTPHFPQPVRWGVAAGTALLFATYVGLPWRKVFRMAWAGPRSLAGKAG
jgi:uncharacterized membrane protein SpoIIM required for sporulation